MKEVSEGAYRLRELEAQRTASIYPYVDAIHFGIDQADITGDPYTVFSIGMSDMIEIATLEPEFDRIQSAKAEERAQREDGEQELVEATKDLIDTLGQITGQAFYDVDRIEEGEGPLGLAPKWTLFNNNGTETGSFTTTRARTNLRIEGRHSARAGLNFRTPTFWEFVRIAVSRA